MKINDEKIELIEDFIFFESKIYLEGGQISVGTRKKFYLISSNSSRI